jgi:hypothetical protein
MEAAISFFAIEREVAFNIVRSFDDDSILTEESKVFPGPI